MKNWKNITLAALLLGIGVYVFVVSFERPPESRAYHPVQFFNKNGQIFRITKIYTDTLSPTTANGYSINISNVGFTAISSVNVVASRNTATPTSVPNVSIKSFSTSAVVVNIVEGNSDLINILGQNVLLGPATVFANTSGLQLHVQILGY